MGKGHEVIARLGGAECTTLKFANIENIHAMRASYISLRQACSGAGGTPNSGSGCSGSGSDWLQAIHDSKWLQHLSDLLKGAIYLATHLGRGLVFFIFLMIIFLFIYLFIYLFIQFFILFF